VPGICGIVRNEPLDGGLARVIAAMQARLMQANWHVASGTVVEEPGCALASVALAHHKRLKTFVDARSGNAIALDGELFGSERPAGESEPAGANHDADEQARAMLAAYARAGSGFARELRGSFAAAIWDASRQRLVLVTDRFGTRPLYYRQTPGGLRFASTLAALLAEDAAAQQVNPRGLAQFFTFGHYLRDDTSLADVRVLPAAACFEYDAGSGALTQRTYWSLKEARVDVPAGDAALLDAVDESFVAAVNRSTSGAPKLGISLSGGLDARAILGVIDARATPLTAVCLGVRGSLDHRSSAELSRIAGCPFHEYVLDGSFMGGFRQHLERMVELTDGQYLSQCIVIPTLNVYRELGIQTLLRGHAGELMHMRKAYSYSLDGEALAIRTDAQLREWLFRRLQAYMLDGVAKPLFRPMYQEGLAPLAAESLDEDLADAAHVEQPLDRIWHLFVSQRLRRETVLSMLKFRSVVEPRLPYLDDELVGLLLAAPSRLKLGEAMQAHILSKRRPEYLRVTNANTGAALGAAAWRQKLASLQMRVLGKLGVSGYQPYERLGLWLRRELAPVVRDVLLSSQTLENGVYAADGVRAVVRGHLEEGKNHTFLLMALMIYELGRRRLCGMHARVESESVLSGSR